MNAVKKMCAVGLLLGSINTFAALPVEGAEGTKKGIAVPKPGTGSGLDAVTAQKGPLSDVLRFKDGDTLHGNVVIIEKGKLTWSRPDINAPIIMELKNLRGVKLFRDGASNKAGSKVELTNSDTYYGEIVSMNEDDFVLDTWYAGRLTIPKCMVRNVRPGSKAGPIILSGFGKLADWPSKDGEPKLSGGQLRLNSGRVGRDLKLPDAVHVQVNVSWNGSYPGFNIVTHTSNTDNFYNDCYNLQINGNYVYLYGGQGNRNFGNHQYRELRKMNKAKIDFFIDKKKQVAVVMINNKLVKKWENLNYSPGGTGFILSSQGSYGATTFSGLKVTKWDGKLPTAGNANAGKGDKEDMVRFTNGDKMSGKILTIAQGKVTLKTEFATMPVPMKNVISMTFSDDDSERARRNKADVNLYFPSGETVTGSLLKMKKGRVTIKSENFETKEFDLRAFIGVKFNVYDDLSDEEKTRFDELIFGE